MSDDKVVRLGEKKDKLHKEKKQEPVLREDGSDINEPVYCSFCGRPNSQVVKMVKGPGVNICSECTMIAVQYLILNDRLPSDEAQKVLDAIWRISK